MIRLKGWPFAIGFVVTMMILLLLNLYLLGRSHELPGGGLCMDCGLPVGFPFTMYRTEYMWGGEGFIASGVFANVCVAAISGSLVGVLFSQLWNAIVTHTARRNLK
jgi:hypothetical protein